MINICDFTCLLYIKRSGNKQRRVIQQHRIQASNNPIITTSLPIVSNSLASSIQHVVFPEIILLRRQPGARGEPGK